MHVCLCVCLCTGVCTCVRGGSVAGSLGGAQQLTDWGGGVVPEIFRALQKAARFSGGGGGSSRQFSCLISRNRPNSVAGEVLTTHSLISRGFSFIDKPVSQDTSKNVNQQKNNSHKKNNFKRSRGAPRIAVTNKPSRLHCNTNTCFDNTALGMRYRAQNYNIAFFWHFVSIT